MFDILYHKRQTRHPWNTGLVTRFGWIAQQAIGATGCETDSNCITSARAASMRSQASSGFATIGLVAPGILKERWPPTADIIVPVLAILRATCLTHIAVRSGSPWIFLGMTNVEVVDFAPLPTILAITTVCKLTVELHTLPALLKAAPGASDITSYHVPQKAQGLCLWINVIQLILNSVEAEIHLLL